jgi:hypothetical protein
MALAVDPANSKPEQGETTSNQDEQLSPQKTEDSE